MKRIISLILTAVLIMSGIATTPVFADSTVLTVFSEDFETGAFEVQTNEAGNVKTLCKDGSPIITFIKKSGSAFSGFPDSPLVSEDTTTNAPLNNTMILDTTSSYPMNSNTIAYINFGQKYTKGKITVDMRIKRPDKSKNTIFYLAEDEITEYPYNGKVANKFEYNVNSSWQSRFRSYSSYISASELASSTFTTVSAAKGFPWLRFVADINNKTISTYYKTAESGSYTLLGSENANWLGNGVSGSYSMADGISGMYFEGSSYLGLDDITVTHEINESAPSASEVTVSGNPFPGSVLTAVYGKYTDANGDEESGSVGTWYAADDSEFTTNVTVLKTEAISAGSSSEYTLTENEVGKYIRFGVTPKNNAADLPEGEEVFAVLENAVRIPQTKPIVTLLTPSNNSQIYQGALIYLTVNAVCDNANITKVEYYANDNLIATADKAPFSETWQSDELEDYAVYAKAYNDLGESGVSETSYISIQYYDPSQQVTEDGARILYKEDFETGVFTTRESIEESGNHRKDIYKDGVLQWTIAKNGTEAFSETFPAEGFVADSTITGSENGSKYFTLGGKHTDGVKVWHNLDEEINSGIVNLDLRMNFSVNSSNYPTCLSLYEEQFTGYASSPKKVFEIRFTKVSAGARVRYSWPWKSSSSRGDATGNTASVNPSSGHWIDFKISVNLDTQKVKIMMKPYGYDEFIPYNNSLSGYDLQFYANSAKSSASTTGTFTRAKKIAAIGFDGDSKGAMAPLTNAVLEFDDIVISHEESTISFLKEDVVASFDNILNGNSKVYAKTIISNNKSEPLNLNLLIAAYNSSNELIATSSGEEYNIAVGETKELLTPLSVDDDLIKNAAVLKGFAWNTATLEPYIKSSHIILEQDVIGEKELEIYLLMGQSNMSGRAPYTTAEGANMDRTYLFNNNNRWAIASNPLNKYSILGDSSSQIAMGPSYTFAKTLTQYIPDMQLGLVVNAKGGSSISQWMKGTFYYENSVAKAKEAMKYGKLKGIIWHQGCSDSSKYSEYMAKLEQLVKDLRTDLGDDTLPFIAGQINPSNDNKAAFNEVITTISEHIPYSSYAKADDFSTIDGTHFDAASQRILGQRYAAEILRMNYGITSRVFEEGNTNLAVGAAAYASSSYSTFTPENANDAATSTYWQAYKADSEITDIPWYILDLGKECSINHINITDKMSNMTTETRQNFTVQLSNDPTFTDYITIGNNEDEAYYQKSTWVCRNASTDKFRYVRVIKTRPENLAFSEIEVMGIAE